MDGFSLIIGGMLGGLAGWAFSSATTRQREANKCIDEALKAEEKKVRMEDEAKMNKRRRFSELATGVFLYIFGFVLIFVLTAILITSAI